MMMITCLSIFCPFSLISAELPGKLTITKKQDKFYYTYKAKRTLNDGYFIDRMLSALKYSYSNLKVSCNRPKGEVYIASKNEIKNFLPIAFVIEYYYTSNAGNRIKELLKSIKTPLKLNLTLKSRLKHQTSGNYDFKVKGKSIFINMEEFDKKYYTYEVFFDEHFYILVNRSKNLKIKKTPPMRLLSIPLTLNHGKNKYTASFIPYSEECISHDQYGLVIFDDKNHVVAATKFSEVIMSELKGNLYPFIMDWDKDGNDEIFVVQEDHSAVTLLNYKLTK